MGKILTHFLSIILVIVLCSPGVFAQDEPSDERYNTGTSGLKFRSIGPAFTSGRIADFAVNPANSSEFYVAVASGGVWKTTNRGVTFKPVFDTQGSYSIGFVAMDPNNHNVVWVGTGENNNQRSVAYGDGVYKSIDGGKSWKNMGLENSEHIGMIEIDPRNSDVVYVAATGPLWSEGGDRGLYKTTDGGETWENILEISEHTGINEVHLDPRNPDVIYATAHQRRRHVFTYISGGPEGAIYKSTDGGASFRKIMKGMPSGDIGRIGLDISPANPDVIYATVEAQQGKSGFYRSTDRGESWEKQSSTSSSGNYYQEVFADPVEVDRVYLMNVFAQVSEDGGKTFSNVGELNKHIDNHALWIDPDNPNYMLNGNDGGVYESYDRGKTWRFFTNLPVTQFYKLAVDNDYPFYNVYGGTQDNFTFGGPTRSIEPTGLSFNDWKITLLGDGFEPHVDPENPDIVYSQAQYGVLYRFDRQSGALQNIIPQPPAGADYAYTWNWDSPFFVSAHDNERLYYASDRVLRSDDMGQSWREISGDLTRQIDRNTLEVMGDVWPMDAIAKNASTTPYGNIVALAESPIDENIVFAGTDDGLIHISQDGGENWARYDEFPTVPEMTYVNEIIPSIHDVNVVYAAFNNHKRGDFKPYILKSTNLGRSWRSISNNLPERGSIYSIEEDFENPDLLFVGTEFSLFMTFDGGDYWKKFSAGLPTISVRDINIQQRENDLVLGTFGRGFYIMDDYSALREFTPEVQENEAHLFSVRDAFQYQPYSYMAASSTVFWLGPKGFQGEDFYMGENAEFGAYFTYYLKDAYQSLEDIREEEEKEMREEDETVYYPTYDQLQSEADQEKAYLIFTVRDANGEVVNELRTSPRKGINRLHWNLKYPAMDEVDTDLSNPTQNLDDGLMVLPGSYSVQLSKSVDGEVTELSEPVNFEVKSLDNLTLPPANPEDVLAYQRELSELSKSANSARSAFNELNDRLEHYQAAARLVESDALDGMLETMESTLDELRLSIFGDPIKRDLEIDQAPSLNSRINTAIGTAINTQMDPTGTSMMVKEIAESELRPVIETLKGMLERDIPAIDAELNRLNAPWTPGRIIELD